MWNRPAALFLCLWPSLSTGQEGPLSAINWLSNSIEAPETGATDPTGPDAETIVVRPLDRAIPDSVGLLVPQATGLPVDLWSASDTRDLGAQLGDLPPLELAATQALLREMLTVSADPPKASVEGEKFFLIRLDTLLAHGAFDPARRLIERAGSDRPAIFRRWFDIALLTGDEDRACQRMRALPEITPTYPARIFCLARSGDWAAAAVTLETARALDVVTPAERELLTRFLDEFAGGLALPPPEQPTPLDYMLYEAIGEPLVSRNLPLAFTHAQLRHHVGWKQQIAAAERLARAGAIGPDELFKVYGERAPAASGEPWDRIAVWQALATSIEAGDPAQVSENLPPFWREMGSAGLLSPAAAWTAPRLDAGSASGPAAEIADRIMLLAGHWDGISTDRESGLPQRILRQDGTVPSTSAEIRAAVAGLTGAEPPSGVADLLANGRTGEALIAAIGLVEKGAAGSLDALRDGLAILRLAGLEERAREAAVEILLTEPQA